MNDFKFDLLSDAFKKELKKEVDKANKRIKRMNDFQLRLFENKGIDGFISRAGSIEDKITAYAQAKLVNDSGISTQSEYNKYIKRLTADLPLKKDEVEYILDSIDIDAMNFASNTTLRLGTDPAIDFLFDDFVQLDNSIENKVDSIADKVIQLLELGDEIIDLGNIF